ncbi:MAG: hypothetical protein ACT4PV_10625 [Planctomycetaceae bacterium]
MTLQGDRTGTAAFGFRLFLGVDGLLFAAMLFVLLHKENRPEVRGSPGTWLAFALVVPCIAAALLLRLRVVPALLLASATAGLVFLWGRADLARGPGVYGAAVSALGIVLVAHYLGGLAVLVPRALRPAPAPLLRRYLLFLAGVTVAAHATVFLG